MNRYFDVNGNEVPKVYTNLHHLIYPEYQYKKSDLSQRFRAVGGFIIRMSLESHRELHTNVKPPIKISDDLIWQIIDHQRDKTMLTPYDRLNSSIDLLNDNVFLDNSHSEQSDKLVKNLKLQREFIEFGRIILL